MSVWRRTRPSSIKTRIKTLHSRGLLRNSRTRPSSIKTRIKTAYSYPKRRIVVRDHLPLKQGLRREHFFLLHIVVSTRPSSIKTRIKTEVNTLYKLFVSSVRDHLPLKQGLRPRFVVTNIKHTCLVRDHLPLKQGLRLSPSIPR